MVEGLYITFRFYTVYLLRPTYSPSCLQDHHIVLMVPIVIYRVCLCGYWLGTPIVLPWYNRSGGGFPVRFLTAGHSAAPRPAGSGNWRRPASRRCRRSGAACGRGQPVGVGCARPMPCAGTGTQHRPGHTPAVRLPVDALDLRHVRPDRQNDLLVFRGY